MQSIEIKKRYLRQYIELKNLIEEETEEAKFWKEEAYTLSATRLDLSGVKSHNVSRFQPIDKFLEIAEYCSDLGDQAFVKKKEIQGAISKLDDSNCRMILEMRYIRGYKFFEIAKKINYSLQHVFAIHKKALDLFEIPKDKSK